MKRKNKYNNTKVTIGSLKFDGKKEANRYQELKELEAQGFITGLQRQVKFELAPSVKFDDANRAKPALRYFADFTYYENGRFIVEDVKSPITRNEKVFIIKRHLLKSVHNLDIRLI